MTDLFLLLALVPCVADGAADVWPGFRHDGSSRTAARNLPLNWSPGENLGWKATLPGYGQSSPIVWRDHVYVTAVDGKEKEKCLVLALSASTGKLLWQKEFAGSQKGRNTPTTSRAAPTPVADAGGVYVLFETGDLLGLGHDGNLRWQRSLVNDYGEWKGPHGLGGSPTQTDRAVIVLIEHQGPCYLLAVDKATGKNLWKTDRASRMSWTSPVIAVQEGRPVVFVSSNGALSGYDAATGKLLWSLEGFTGNNIPSPTVAGDRVVIGATEGRQQTDAAGPAKSNCCVRLTSKEGRPAAEVAWYGKRAISQHASPLIHQGLVYFVTPLGVVHCLDVETGETRYAERLDDPCWATPVAAGDRIYFFGRNGITTVLAAGPRLVKLATNRLWNEDDFNAHKEAAKKLPENQPSAVQRSSAGRGERPASPPTPSEDPRYYDALGDVVYGVAAVEGSFILRTGTELYCLRAP